MNTVELAVKPEQFSIQPEKAIEMTSTLAPLKAEREGMMQVYQQILTMDLDDPETAKQANELRLKLVKNRTSIEKWHKNAKEVALKMGQFLDAVKRSEVEANTTMESNLKEVIDYAENKRREELEAKRLKRVDEIEKKGISEFIISSVISMIGELSEEEYASVIASATALKDKRDEEQRIEAERIEEEKRLNALADSRREEILNASIFLGREVLPLSDLKTMSVEEFSNYEKSLNDAKAEKEAENARLRKEAEEAKAAAEKANREAEMAKKQAAEAEAAKKKAEQDRIDAENKRIEAEKLAQQQKIDSEKKIEWLTNSSKGGPVLVLTGEVTPTRPTEADKPSGPKEAALFAILLQEAPKFPSIATPEMKALFKEIEEKFNAYKEWAKTKLENVSSN